MEEVVEDTREPFELSPTSLKRYDGIGEGRCIGLLDDGLDLTTLLGNSFGEGRTEVRHLDFVEGISSVIMLTEREEAVHIYDLSVE